MTAAHTRRVIAALSLTVVLAAAAACGSSQASDQPSASGTVSTPAPTSSAPASSPAPTSSSPTSPHPTSPHPTSPHPTSTHPTSTHPSPTKTKPKPTPTPTHHPVGKAPVIVIDPGHSPTVHGTYDGLNVSDYENEPEMHDVFKVALLVKAQLQAAGYKVVMTKTSVDQRRNLAQRAEVANRVHAALAISIHDQAGRNGGIGFRAGNNTVYYQSVGTYRATPSGHRVYFRNSALAAVSKRYGAIFGRERRSIEGTRVAVQGSVGYNLGSRGLAAGDIWLVQLLSHVPWIYNESGGNSAGRIGLSATDRATYARALVAAVEKCVPIRR